MALIKLTDGIYNMTIHISTFQVWATQANNTGLFTLMIHLHAFPLQCAEPSCVFKTITWEQSVLS